MALQGFGGVLAVVQREIVDRKRWMTRQEFIEEWSVAQIMPGPNVINLSILMGNRCFGWRGSCAAVVAAILVWRTRIHLLLRIHPSFPHPWSTPCN